MSDSKEKNYNFLDELKVLFIFALIFLGFSAIKSTKLPLYMIVTTLGLVFLNRYVFESNLSFSKVIMTLVFAFYNVITLFFMIQYLLGKSLDEKIYKVFLYPFMNIGQGKIFYIGWIFLLTLYLLILENKTKSLDRKDYGR